MSSSVNQQEKKFTDNSNSVNSQYGNLNLNQSHKCQPKDLGSKKNDNLLIVKKENFAMDSFKENSSNPKTIKIKPSPNPFINYNDEEEVVSWKKTSKQKDTDNRNGSTLSLHIAAYESAIISGSTTVKNEDKEPKDKTGLIKRQAISHQLTEAPFKIPRQQHEQQPPEVMPFRSSQVLFKPQPSAQPCRYLRPHFFPPMIHSLKATVQQPKPKISPDMKRHQNMRQNLINHQHTKPPIQSVIQPSASAKKVENPEILNGSTFGGNLTSKPLLQFLNANEIRAPSPAIKEDHIDTTAANFVPKETIQLSDSSIVLLNKDAEPKSDESSDLLAWTPTKAERVLQETGKLIAVHTLTLSQIEAAINVMRLQNEWAHDSPYLQYHPAVLLPDVFPYPIEDVVGDGNCGFRAISKALTGNEMFHWDLRILATETLATTNFRNLFQAEREAYANFLPILMDLEIQEMPQEYWCASNHLIALAFKLQITIATVTKQRNSVSYQFYTPLGLKRDPDPNFPTIYLKYNGSHYQVILPSH